MEILISFVGILRTVCMFIDTVAFGLIDNAYNLISDLTSMEIFNANIIKSIMMNLYVIMGLFAFFRIAVILVNSMINPDKLNEKGNGITNVGINILIMFALLIAVPIVFEKAYEYQGTIVNEHIVEKMFLNTDTLEKSDPGRAMQSIAIGSLITWNDNITSCTGKCEDAKKAYENMAAGKTADGTENYKEGGFKLSSLSNYASVEASTSSGEKEFVYNYTILVTFGVGVFLAYVLFSFAIDIGVRTVELAVLEIISPLFIATYIDPKSAKSGPFKNWVTTTLKTYASLFIKLAIISLMLLLVSLIPQIDFSGWTAGGIGKLTLLIAILIFAKKAPEWIGKLIGVDVGLGGLGIGKKLGSAALIGGALSKGLDSAKKFGAQKAKNFGANRLRNTASRIGAAKEELALRRKEAKEGNKSMREARKNALNEGRSLWNVGKKAAAKTSDENYGKDAQGLLKDLSAGYLSGRLNVDSNAKTINQKKKARAEEKNKRLNDEFEAAKRKENYDKLKESKKMYQNVEANVNNERKKVMGPNGEEVFVNPRGTKEMNAAFNNPITTYGAFEQLGKNMVTANGNLEITSSGQVRDKSTGKVIANSAVEYGIQNTTRSGRLAIKSLVAQNVSQDASNYQEALSQRENASKSYVEEVSRYNETRSKLASDPAYSNYRDALTAVNDYNEAAKNLDAASQKANAIASSSDYKLLKSSDPATLNSSEKARLDSYENGIKAATDEVNKYNSIMISKQGEAANGAKVIKQVEDSAGITVMKENIERSKTQLAEWQQTVTDYEDKFKNTMVPDVNIETGQLGSSKNPYVVKIGGQDYNVGDPKSLVKFEEIKSILSTNASNAKKDFDESMKSEAEGK